MTIRLRVAVGQDRYPLWLWANDPASRVASNDRPPIAWADHCGWFAARCREPGTLILMAETEDGQPVGVVRFESSDEWRRAWLSYAVAPEVRGRGVGRGLLMLGVSELLRRTPEVLVLARVRGSNLPSVHLFQSLGWAAAADQDGWIRFTWRNGGEAG